MLLVEVLDPFFKGAHIQETLRALRKGNGVTGWEKWLQIELTTFLLKHRADNDWEREKSYKLVCSKSERWHRCAVDFLLGKTRIEGPVALEVKQRKVASGCVSAMIKDLARLATIRESERTGISSYWCLGIHPSCRMDLLRQHASRFTREIGLISMPLVVWSSPVGNTDFSYTLLSQPREA